MDRLLDQTVSVITNDGRNIIGCLKGTCWDALRRPTCQSRQLTSPTHFPRPRREPRSRVGFDQALNVVLEECHERVYSEDAGVEQVVLGLYIIRGDNIAIVGEMDLAKDQEVDLSQISAEPLKPVVH